VGAQWRQPPLVGVDDGLKIKGLEVCLSRQYNIGGQRKKSLSQSRLLRFSLDPTFAPVPVLGVFCALASTDDSVFPRAAKGVGTSATQLHLRMVFCRSPHWPCIGANDQPALGGQKEAGGIRLCTTDISLLCRHLSSGIRRPLQLLFTIVT